MRQTAGAALLAVLVALAGCGGFVTGAGDAAGAPGETPTLTPLPVPSPSTETAAVRVAPGVSRERVVDVGALASAHAAVLANTSYTVRETVVERYRNGTVRGRYRSVVRREGERVSYRLVQRGRTDDATIRIERYGDGDRLYVARATGNESYAFSVAAAGTRTISSGVTGNAGSLRRLFSLLPVSVVGSRQVGAETHYRLRTPEPRSVVPLENVTLVADVTSAGVVRFYRVNYTVERPGAETRVSVRVVVDDLGTTTVSEPPWYERARNATRADAPQS